ncbi:MAG: hypothetical protein AAFP69_15155, partial [Planctomycetota bacterium]
MREGSNNIIRFTVDNVVNVSNYDSLLGHITRVIDGEEGLRSSDGDYLRRDVPIRVVHGGLKGAIGVGS